MMRKTRLISGFAVVQVRVIAVLTALIAFMNVFSALTPAMPWRLAFIHDLLPLELDASTRLATVLSGFALLLLSRGLWRRKRNAWLITVIVLAISLVAHLLKGFDFEEALVTGALLTSLLVMQKHFQAYSDTPSVKQGVRTILGAFVFTLVYGILGFFLLDKHFSINFSFADAVKQTLLMFLEYSNPHLEPMTGFGEYFAGSIYVVSAATLAHGLFMLLRPVLDHRQADSLDHLRAKGVVEMYGHSSLARMTLFPDKRYFFFESVVIAYVIHEHTALVLGDPIGPDHQVFDTIREFIALCQRNDWGFTFYQTNSEYLSAYKRMGCKTLCIGHEGTVDLNTFTLSGNSNRSMRGSYNRLVKLGYFVRVVVPPHSNMVIQTLWNISDEWLSHVYGEEKKFSFGWFTEEYLQSSVLLLVYNAHGKICAFTNFVPEYRLNELTVDLMRYTADADSGTMDFMFISLMFWAQQQGYDTFNFGLSALYDTQQPESDNLMLQRMLSYIYENSHRFYNFKGVHFFKEKFHPEWSPRYLIYPSTGSLPRTFLALMKAYKG